MTMMMYFVAPMMMGQKMDIAAMLGSMLGNNWLLGIRCRPPLALRGGTRRESRSGAVRPPWSPPAGSVHQIKCK